MVENIEKLTVDAELHSLMQSKPLRQIQIVPVEIGTAQGVAAQIAELAVFRAVAAGAGARARIHRRNKRIGVEPLNGSRLRNAGNWVVFIERYAGNNTGVLGTTALEDAAATGGVRRAQNREGYAAVPKDGSRHLPSV